MNTTFFPGLKDVPVQHPLPPMRTPYVMELMARRKEIWKTRLTGRGEMRCVRCVEAGLVYPSRQAAAQAFKGDPQSIYIAIRDGTTAFGFHWENV